MLTERDLKQLEWEASDDEDAPEEVNKAWVRELLLTLQKVQETWHQYDFGLNADRCMKQIGETLGKLDTPWEDANPKQPAPSRP